MRKWISLGCLLSGGGILLWMVYQYAALALVAGNIFPGLKGGLWTEGWLPVLFSLPAGAALLLLTVGLVLRKEPPPGDRTSR